MYYHCDNRYRLGREREYKARYKDGRWNKFRQITTTRAAMTQVKKKVIIIVYKFAVYPGKRKGGI